MESCLHAGKSPIRFFALGKRGHKTIKSKLKFSDGSFPSRQKLALVFSCLSGLIVGLEMLLTLRWVISSGLLGGGIQSSMLPGLDSCAVLPFFLCGFWQSGGHLQPQL